MQENNYKATEFHKQFSATLVEAMRTTGAPFQKEVDGKLPFNPISGAQYNTVNLVGLSMAAEKIAKKEKIPVQDMDQRWLTLRQANSEGMKVKPQSKATPMAYYSWTDKEPKRDANGDPIPGENGKPEMQTVYLNKPVLKTGYLFHASQIENMPLEKTPEKTAEEKRAALERAEALVKASGAVFVHDERHKQPFYDRFQDVINMPPKESYPSREAYLGEAINQLSYWTGHESRLDRQTGPNGSSYRSREELTTAMGTWVTLNTLGLEGATFNNRNLHVQGMVGLLAGNPYEAMQSCKAADAIRDHLLGLEKQKDLTSDRAQEEEIERSSRAAALGKPAQDMPGLQTMSPEEELKQALTKAGINIGEKPIMWDGSTQDVGKGTYTATKGDVPEAMIHNKETGLTQKWVATGHKLTPQAVEQQRETAKEARREKQPERAKAAEQGIEAGKMPAPAKDKGKSRGLGL